MKPPKMTKRHNIGIDVGPCPYNGWDGDYYRLTLGLITEPNSAMRINEAAKAGKGAK